VVHQLVHQTDQQQVLLRRPALHRRAQLNPKALRPMEHRPRLLQVPILRMEITHNGPTIIKIIRDITSKKMANQTNLMLFIQRTKEESDFFDILDRNHFLLFYF